MFFAPTELTPERRDEMVERAARAVVKRRLSTPANLALEMHKPIAVLGANLVLLGTPLLAPFIGWRECDDLAFFLMDRENLERLHRRIEALSAERKPTVPPTARSTSLTALSERSESKGYRQPPTGVVP